MKIALKVTFLDESVKDVEASFADFVAFERTWQRSVARFEQEVRLTDLAWLAWNNLSRTKQTTLKFDPDWVATVESVSVNDEAGEIPLEMTPPLG
jgi:hypothetical protein